MDFFANVKFAAANEVTQAIVKSTFYDKVFYILQLARLLLPLHPEIAQKKQPSKDLSKTNRFLINAAKFKSFYSCVLSDALAPSTYSNRMTVPLMN